MHARHRRGFTLIELLVVIAIIALLVALLLPALGKARIAAWLTKSMSNIRQITIAANTYKEDFKQYMPLTLTYGPRYDPPIPVPNPAPQGWMTWSYGGKNADRYWTTQNGGAWDWPAADRPLNKYVYPELIFDAPPAPQAMTAADPRRTAMQLEVYKDPLDRYSYQHGNYNDPNGPASIALSSYDDVGTSYHFNIKWWDQVKPEVTGLTFARAFAFGCDRLRLSDAFQPSRMVWLHDQVSDVVANNPNVNFRLRSVAGDYNKSVMAFMDGHGGYHPVRPGNLNPPEGSRLPSSYKNEIYTFVFEDLRLPRR